MVALLRLAALAGGTSTHLLRRNWRNAIASFVPCPNVAEVAAIYQCFGQITENVYHVQGGAAWTLSSLNALAAEVVTWEGTNARNQRHDNVELLHVTAVDLTSATGLQVDYSTGLPIAGVATGGEPNNVTVAIKHTTGHRGRSFRGRSFWIGLYASVITQNQITAPMITALVANMNALDSLFAGVNSGQMCVTSKYHGVDPITGKPVPRATGVSTPIIGFTVNPTLDSQRRRLPEHNRHR